MAPQLHAAAAQLSAALSLDAGDTIDSVEHDIVEGPHLPTAQWSSAASACARSSSNDQKQGQRLVEALASAGTARVEAYFSVFLTDAPVTNFAQAQATSVPAYAALFHSMLDQGVHLPPSAFEAWFVSSSHDDRAVQRVLDALPVAARAAEIGRAHV